MKLKVSEFEDEKKNLHRTCTQEIKKFEKYGTIQILENMDIKEQFKHLSQAIDKRMSDLANDKSELLTSNEGHLLDINQKT